MLKDPSDLTMAIFPAYIFELKVPKGFSDLFNPGIH